MLKIGLCTEIILKLESLVKERINENKKLFSKDENKVILSNVNLINKIYLIGFLDNKF